MRCGGMEIWKRGAGAATWRYRGLQLWRYAVAAAIWRYGGLERRWGGSDRSEKVWRYGDLETRCRRGDTEVWRNGALEAVLSRSNFIDE